MNPLRHLICLAVLASALALPAHGSPARFNHETMMPSAEVKRGMVGVGKSVFAGTEITEFGIEIIAVLEKADLGKDLILGRILDGPVVERKSGVMGGMSGSPVYIDGRLIGAVAYTWTYSREPVAGITAIEGMLEALEDPERQAALSPFATTRERYSSRRGPVEVLGRRISQVRVVPAAEAHAPFADDHTLLMYRVAPPVYCAGLPEQAREYLGEFLKPHGIEPVAGPGMMRNPVDTELVPGAAVGSVLVSGDFDISTAGTVTYRDGDLILAFGHPFMELGKVDLPMTTAWVHDFIPRYSRTDKLMSPMKEVGALTQDRQWAVGGRLGPPAGRVPATLRVIDQTRDLTRTYRVEVVRNRDLTARLLSTSALSAVFSSYSGGGQGMVRVKSTVTGSRGNSITREDRYFHTGNPAFPAIGSLMEASSILNTNRFRPQDVVALDYEVELNDRNETAVIEDLWADQTVARAGEEITLRVRVRPDDGDVVERRVTLQVPLDVQRGRLRIGVAGGTDAMRMRSRLGVLRPTFYSLEDVIEFYEALEPPEQLYVAAGAPTRDIAVQGSRLPGLPPFLRQLIQDSPRTDIVTGSGELSVTLDTPWVLYGSAQLMLPTEDREGRRGTIPAPRPPEPSEEAPESAAVSLPRGVPASLWWAAGAFHAPQSAHGGPPSASYPRSGSPRPATTDNGAEDGDDDAEAEEGEEEGEDEDEDNGEPEEKPEGNSETTARAEQPKDRAAGAVARRPTVWAQTTAAHFSEGEPEGVAVHSDGAVSLVPHWRKLHQFDEFYVNALAAGDGALYAGSMGSGRIYRVTDDGVTLLHDTGQFGVSALHVKEDGSLLAATFPGGRILHITPDGEGRTWCRLDAEHVWDLVPDGKGGYWAGVGPGAAVYHIDAEGVAERVLPLRQAHVMRLLMVGDDLYIATAQKGALYRMTPDRQLTSIYDAGSDDLTSLAVDDKGRLLVGTAPEGKVVAVDPSGTSRELYSAGRRAVLSVLPFRGRLLVAMGGKGQVVEIIDADTHAILREDRESQVMGLYAVGKTVYAACANPGLLLRADFNAACDGTLESGVLDAGRRSVWGRVDWSADVPEDGRLALRFRVGNTADPEDASWTTWSLPMLQPGRDRPAVPPARFLQYRLEMGKEEGAEPPSLQWIRLHYLPANQPPTIKDFKPEEGDAISRKHKVTWKMEDPDKDQLQARLLARRHGATDYELVKEGLTKAEYEWDTAAMKDGVYDLRLIVDDSPANPTDARETQLDVRNVTLDNTPPEIALLVEPTRQEDGTVSLSGFALDETSIIAGIAWRENGSESWRAATLEDGLYDSRYERFSIRIPPRDKPLVEIIIRARDAAGNVTDRTVKLPAGKEAPEPDKENALG